MAVAVDGIAWCAGCKESIAVEKVDGVEVCPFCGNPATDFGSYIDWVCAMYGD